MVTNEFNDLWIIIQNMDKAQAALLPEKFIEFVKCSIDPAAEASVDPSVPLEEQQLSEETRSLLSSLLLTYWSEGADDRRQYAEKLHRNEQIYAGEEPTTMTEEEYQELLSFFDDWDEFFGPIPFWAESRKK